MAAATDYKSTIALPKTSFAMKANLAQREPERLARWQEMDLYRMIIERNHDLPRFVLHDGPPYANGNIHHGHVLNKVLKDIVVKVRNMSGQCCEFVPGWDCHGLPIEHQIDKKLGSKKRDMTTVQVRQACREYALKHVDIQRQEFERLGVLADWKNPYLTLDKHYEAQIVRELGKFADRGLYKGTKPVHWCGSCRTALAEAEVEYCVHRSPSIYVAFDVCEGAEAVDTGDKPLRVVIWTTTPWTLPADRAVAYGSNIEYRAYPHGDGFVILSVELREAVEKDCGLSFDSDASVAVSAEQLGHMKAAHPFLDNVVSPLLPADFVRTETGTGLVHVAPGHGPDDFILGSRHGIEVVSPVDARGCLTDEAGVCSGEHVFKANPKIIELLVEKGRLLSPPELSLEHDYPNCWRCKKPVIFRATPQWFVSMQEHGLREKALAEVEKVKWIPAWGHDRIHGMLSARPDWCLSRQRTWGVPIPAFYCEKCDAAILHQDNAEHLADIFEKEGSDAWYARESAELLPEGFICPDCGASEFRKENDIVDVWFESGISYAAVCEHRDGLDVPADLYLEGSDQHRGWFHSSLLAAVGTRGTAPYKAVLTHGFVVDSQGHKYSKSSKNFVSPDKIIKQNGAEILRLWVCATDFSGDLHFSNEGLKRLVEAYRKNRNTMRFMLGNLADFDPKSHRVDDAALSPVDAYMLARFGQLVATVRKAYDSYELHTVFQKVNEFVVVELSAFYFDLLKDWLYCDPLDGRRRRSAQTALYRMCKGLLSLMAPVLSFTSDEAYEHLPDDGDKEVSVHLTRMPEAEELLALDDGQTSARFDRLRRMRDHVLTLLEPFRAQKHHPLEARVMVAAGDETRNFLQTFEDLPAYFSVSQIEFVDEGSRNDLVRSDTEPGFAACIDTALGQKCARCWSWSAEVGKGRHGDLCPRCESALASQ